jgi:uncharacterized protein
MHNPPSPLKFFFIPTLISVLALLGVWVYLGLTAFFTALLLVVLEVSLSFENAVVNARVLERMTPLWQDRFLTWGIFVAVFLTRAVLPILIVSGAVLLSPVVVAKLAFFDPVAYGKLLHDAEHIIATFGGMFLTMVGLKYFFDAHKAVHWIDPLEKRFAQWGSIEALEIAIALVILALVAFFSPGHQVSILFAGVVALILFIFVQGVANSFSRSMARVASAGFGLFVYLEILDAAFSLDSVVGAFALSTQIPIIIIGLGIGAYFVRALTIYLVHHKTLSRIAYIEHGAHWAILGLAAAMFAGMFMDVPEPITGFVGLLFIGSAYLSSIRLAAPAQK